ncbi:MAG TPA: phage major capsid protein [Egibacteraceae bacterium]|nr:phage major capsid protein [Acidimicrobiales bacterium]HVM15486.1 phage major capsid protein [Egibacteraceae bacterium]
MASGYTSASGGATLTREQVESILIEPLKAQAVVLAARPRLFFSNGGVPLRIPRLDAFDLTDPWRSENTLIKEEDPDFGEVVLLPSSLKSLKVLHRISNELARHAVTDIANTLGTAMVSEVARAFDAAALVGTGAANTVTGLANSTGVQTTAGVGTPTVDDLYDAEGKLMAANANPATAAWFMAPRDLTALRKQREGAGTGAYLLQPSPTEAGRLTLLGHPVYVTTGIPTNGGAGTESKIILADMQQVAVGIDAEPTFTILDQTYGDWDQVALRVVARMDIAPLNPAGVVVLTGVTP